MVTYYMLTKKTEEDVLLPQSQSLSMTYYHRLVFLDLDERRFFQPLNKSRSQNYEL